jgi:hypothetical protein
MHNVTTAETSNPTRIFARQMARELSHDEVNLVSGGMRVTITWCGFWDGNSTNGLSTDDQ